MFGVVVISPATTTWPSDPGATNDERVSDAREGFRAMASGITPTADRPWKPKVGSAVPSGRKRWTADPPVVIVPSAATYTELIAVRSGGETPGRLVGTNVGSAEPSTLSRVRSPTLGPTTADVLLPKTGELVPTRTGLPSP